MKIALTSALCLGFCLVALPGFAQAPASPKGVEKTPDANPPAAPRPPAPPAASPDEISHQAMVEEQERRDREEQAERDRDDQA
jgi:hypothetical protein